LFGHAEAVLVKEKIRALILLVWSGSRADRSHQLKVRLQGSVQWQGIWEELTTIADKSNLRSLCLNVNAPALHEGYHARWDRFNSSISNEEAHDWRADLPISLGGKVIGRLIAVGLYDDEPIWIKLQHLADIVKHTEQQIEELTELHSVRLKIPPPVSKAALIKKAVGAAS
jgi:UDP-GlcNAc:undecaprenyl-phosphate GlcNAc-1-phosphate transferase